MMILGIYTVNAHIVIFKTYKLYAIRIIDITDWRNIIGTNSQFKEKKRKVYASQVQLRALRKGPLTSKLARASPIGPNSQFDLKSVYPQSESGSVAKDIMGKIQEVHTIHDMSAIYCYLLWALGSMAANPPDPH
eukprot:1161109-Pelagomonas_calceolata.AAC.1